MGNRTRTSMPCARSAAGSAALTSPRPPVLVSGAHSGVTKRTRIKKKTPVGGPGSDAYIRTKGGRCVCKGGKVCDAPLGRRLWRGRLTPHLMHRQRGDLVVAAAKLLAHRDVEAGRAVDHLGAERAHQRGLLLGRLELDEAH